MYLVASIGTRFMCVADVGELTASVISLLSRSCMASVSMEPVAVLRLIPVSIASVSVLCPLMVWHFTPFGSGQGTMALCHPY